MSTPSKPSDELKRILDAQYKAQGMPALGLVDLARSRNAARELLTRIQTEWSRACIEREIAANEAAIAALEELAPSPGEPPSR